MTFLGIANLVILGFFLAMEAQLLFMTGVSYRALSRDRFMSRHGRLRDLLRSDTTPPVTIIIPAFNEAAGIVEAVRSISMLQYPAKEIIVVNDGSTDATLEAMLEAFMMEPIDVPFRPLLATRTIRAIYKSRLPLDVVLVDKENGGKGDAINAGINISRYPYFMATDADIVLDDECLLRAMRHVVEDRPRTVAVGGNVRPLNGCKIRRGRVVEVGLPESGLEVFQVVEYIRSFISARPGWSDLHALVLVSGAFGLFHKNSVVEVGGFRVGHLGEDLELTMRLHRSLRDRKEPYRIVYAPDAVAWTEVPSSYKDLKRQRTRWHRGLRQVVWEYKGMLFNPRYRMLGMIVWPSFVTFEFLAPMIEFWGWIIIPLAIAAGALNWSFAVPLFLIAFTLGVLNTLIGLFLDERFGYYDRPRDAFRLLAMSILEQAGTRQRTVWWRVKAMLSKPAGREWGEMQRVGVGNLARGSARD